MHRTAPEIRQKGNEMSFSTANLVGNLGRDPEVKYTASGKAVANFSVAINDGTKDAPHTSWVSCTAWEYAAERMGEMRKGDPVAVFGRLREESWTSQTGEKRTKLTVVASVVYPVAARGEPSSVHQTPAQDATPGASASTREQGPAASDPDESNLPF
jgi:single-strand DNA-binding protein